MKHKLYFHRKKYIALLLFIFIIGSVVPSKVLASQTNEGLYELEMENPEMENVESEEKLGNEVSENDIPEDENESADQEETSEDAADDSTDSNNTEDQVTDEDIIKATGTDMGAGTEEEDGLVAFGEIPLAGNGLTMDGSYDEWEGYPKTDITYLNNNTTSVHYGQIALHDDMLYLHFAMDHLYTRELQFQDWYFTVNGQDVRVSVLPVDNSGNILWNYNPVQENGNQEGTYTQYGVFVGYYNDAKGSVAYTMYDRNHATDTKGDEIEFSLDMKVLAQFVGMPVDQISTITVKNPNIGNEGVTISGTPTGPYLGIAIAFLLTVPCFVALKKSRKEEES